MKFQKNICLYKTGMTRHSTDERFQYIGGTFLYTDLSWIYTSIEEFLYRIPETHSSGSSDGKSVMDFFHSYVNRQDFSIALLCPNRHRHKGH